MSVYPKDYQGYHQGYHKNEYKYSWESIRVIRVKSLQAMDVSVTYRY